MVAHLCGGCIVFALQMLYHPCGSRQTILVNKTDPPQCVGVEFSLTDSFIVSPGLGISILGSLHPPEQLCVARIVLLKPAHFPFVAAIAVASVASAFLLVLEEDGLA